MDCASLDPGTPGGGALGTTEWFAKQNAYMACRLAESAQDATLQEGGDAAWKLGTVVVAGAGLFDAGGLSSNVSAYEAAAMAVAGSQGHDVCGALLGDANPTCGNDPGVSQAQSCQDGVAVPNPVGGGLVGNTLTNANGALQASCAFQGTVLAVLPSDGEVSGFAGGSQATLLSIGGDASAAGGALLNAICFYLTGSDSCVDDAVCPEDGDTVPDCVVEDPFGPVRAPIRNIVDNVVPPPFNQCGSGVVYVCTIPPENSNLGLGIRIHVGLVTVNV